MTSRTIPHMDDDYTGSENFFSYNPDAEKHPWKSEMTESHFNPELDLGLQRTIDLPVENIWRAWTNPELLKQWFCPQPWQVTQAEIDPRPGGLFYTVMRSPEGEEFENISCIVVADKNKRLVWTDALWPGFRPAKDPTSSTQLFFTAILEFESLGGRTHLKAQAKHRDVEGRKQHEAMGFYQGWNICLDQMVALLEQEQKLERAKRFDADWYIDM